MILKIGKIYKFEKKLIFIIEKRRFKRRLIYTIRKVSASGVLGPAIDKMFKRGECKLVPGCKVITYIQLPEKIKETAKFSNLAKRARRIIQEKKSNYKMEVAKLAICCAEFQHPTDGRACNLRDFAKDVKFKSFNTLYLWVLKYYQKHYTAEKFNTAIPNSADRTIVEMVRTHQDTLMSYYGFNYKLNALLDLNVNAYLNEFNLRGLEL